MASKMLGTHWRRQSLPRLPVSPFVTIQHNMPLHTTLEKLPDVGFMLSLITVVYDDIVHGASEAGQAGEGLVHTAICSVQKSTRYRTERGGT